MTADFQKLLEILKNENVPFLFDEKTFATSRNLTLMTDLGAIDLFDAIPGFDSYSALLEQSDIFELFGLQIPLISLTALILNKQKTARPKDLRAVAELQEIQKLKS